MAAETMRSFLLFETLLGQFEVTLGLLWGHCPVPIPYKHYFSLFYFFIISGIPLVSSANNGSPASSQGPSSIHSVTSNPPNSGKPPSLTSNGSSSGGTRSAGLNGVMSAKNSGPENSSNHEYYNDYDRFKNLQPLKLQPPPAKHETTV